MRIVLKWDGKDFEGWGLDWEQRWWEVVGLFGWQGRFETCPYVSGALAWIGGIGGWHPRPRAVRERPLRLGRWHG